MSIDYRDTIFKEVSQPLTGVRTVQSGVTTLTGGTTIIPVSNITSPSNKVYLLTSHLDQDRNTGAQGYTAKLNHSVPNIEVSVSSSSFAGDISWQIVEVY